MFFRVQHHRDPRIIFQGSIPSMFQGITTACFRGPRSVLQGVFHGVFLRVPAACFQYFPRPVSGSCACFFFPGLLSGILDVCSVLPKHTATYFMGPHNVFQSPAACFRGTPQRLSGGPGRMLPGMLAAGFQDIHRAFLGDGRKRYIVSETKFRGRGEVARKVTSDLEYQNIPLVMEVGSWEYWEEPGRSQGSFLFFSCLTVRIYSQPTTGPNLLEGKLMYTLNEVSLSVAFCRCFAFFLPNFPRFSTSSRCFRKLKQ